MNASRRELTVLADHYQFHLRDSALVFSAPTHWPPEARRERVLLAPGFVAVLTAKPYFVPLTIEVATAAPELELESWDHVALCDLAVTSDAIVIAGGAVTGRDTERLALASGVYRLAVLSGNLDRSAPDAGGDDYYKIVLWPCTRPDGTRIAKYAVSDEG